MPVNSERGVLTMAFGKPHYIKMAEALGAGLRRYCPHLPLAVVTDVPTPRLEMLYDLIIPLRKEWGRDVVQKLHLDLYTPFESTLFVDCDCLVFGSLDYVFEAMEDGKSIIPDDLYFHDRLNPKPGIDFVRLEQKTGYSSLPGFNGGVYHIRKGARSERIFQAGRVILQDYKNYGIDDFRSGPNDENVLSLAMEQIGYEQVRLPKQVMRETFGLSGEIAVDSIRGTAALECYGQVISPVIVHFCSGWRDFQIYDDEMAKLGCLHRGWPAEDRIAGIVQRKRNFVRKLRNFSARLWAKLPPACRYLIHGVNSRLQKIMASKVAIVLLAVDPSVIHSAGV